MTLKVENILNNKDRLTVKRAEEILTKVALLTLPTDKIIQFEANAKNILIEYINDPILKLSSHSSDFGRTQSFFNWRDELIKEKNGYMPLIIAKMMKGDILSYNVYQEIYEKMNHNELVLTNCFEKSSPIHDALLLSGSGNPSVQAVLNAEYWLNSNEAENVLCPFLNAHPELGLLVSNCSNEIA